MRKSRGFSLIEVLVALLILGIVITTTISMFAERQKRMRMANETILAYQALSNESEIWRRIDFASLDTQPPIFQSDTSILAPLAPYVTSVKIDS
ncbi:MAG TPA: type II secretion system protein, partial [Thermoanaerobaculia bacterium]|nr:type II secretion system protein [Thermoanaerobaculia bacterium]